MAIERSVETQVADLWEAVLNLSLPGEDQLKLLEAMGDANAVDELALAMDDSFRVVNEAFASEQLGRDELTSLNLLNNHLDKMSGEENANLWTPQGLRQSGEWQEARRLATNAILSKQISRLRRASA